MPAFPPGHYVWGQNPLDGEGKPRRPAIVVWSTGADALVAFGQSQQGGEGPCFVLVPSNDPKQRPQALDHATYFYLSDFVVKLTRNLTPSGEGLGRGDHKKVVEFLRKQDRKSTRLNSSHDQISYA